MIPTSDAGSFELGGAPYRPSAVHEVAKAGIARTFQNIRLFAEMTALENVMVGRHVRTHSGLIGAVLRTPKFRHEEAAIAERAQALLDYVGIGKYTDYKARTLSYGDQRRLEIARALATDPTLIALAMIGIMLSRPRGLWPSPEHGRLRAAGTEAPPPQGPGGELPVKLPHGELPPATQIPPTTGHIVPTDR